MSRRDHLLDLRKHRGGNIGIVVELDHPRQMQAQPQQIAGMNRALDAETCGPPNGLQPWTLCSSRIKKLWPSNLSCARTTSSSSAFGARGVVHIHPRRWPTSLRRSTFATPSSPTNSSLMQYGETATPSWPMRRRPYLPPAPKPRIDTLAVVISVGHRISVRPVATATFWTPPT